MGSSAAASGEAARALPFSDTVRAMWRARDEHNRDNVTRTSAYLNLYTAAREAGHELPWLLMAHLVSRNAGIMMVDVQQARRASSRPSVFRDEALIELFGMLERSNFLIFYDAFRHVLAHLGRALELDLPGLDEYQPASFVERSWRRYETGASPSVGDDEERRLVLDLVENEQRFIHHRSVHHPRFAAALAIVRFIESLDKQAPLRFPIDGPTLKVAAFQSLTARIETGRNIFDHYLRDASRREQLLQFSRAHPHDGSAMTLLGRPSMTLAEAWPVELVRDLVPGVHAGPEPDPTWV